MATTIKEKYSKIKKQNDDKVALLIQQLNNQFESLKKKGKLSEAMKLLSDNSSLLHDYSERNSWRTEFGERDFSFFLDEENKKYEVFAQMNVRNLREYIADSDVNVNPMYYFEDRTLFFVWNDCFVFSKALSEQDMKKLWEVLSTFGKFQRNSCFEPKIKITREIYNKICEELPLQQFLEVIKDRF